VLLADEATRREVQPVYVSVGLAWEAAERQAVEALLRAWSGNGRFGPLANLSVDMRDVYSPSHWALTGKPPAYDTPDEDVYLPGRNVVLLGKAAVYCASRGIARLVLGTLEHNPFPDATPAFRDAMRTALSLGLAHDLEIEAPYASMDKAAVIRRGVALGVPMALSLSCMQPIVSPGAVPLHCGTCSKCRERHDAFVEAGITDPTSYADLTFVAR
jgi:7-cyano-7-deazaguanine synthase